MSHRAALLDDLAAGLAGLAGLVRRLAEDERAAAQKPEPDPFLSREEVGVDVATWRRICASGELPATKIGRAYRARRSDVARWLESRRVVPRPEPTRATRVRHRPANDHTDEEPGDELDRVLRRRRG